MYIFLSALIMIFLVTSCGTNSSESTTEISAEFVSDSKNYYPPKPPSYTNSNSKVVNNENN